MEKLIIKDSNTLAFSNQSNNEASNRVNYLENIEIDLFNLKISYSIKKWGKY